MRHALELRTGQHLVLTPQLQQSLRLLQCSALDLQAELAQVLQDNPMLELVDNNQISEENTNVSENDAELLQQDWSSQSGQKSRDDEYFQPETAVAESLADHLRKQLRLTHASERDVSLADYLIEELDDNGYLQTDLQEIATFFSEDAEVDEDDLAVALRLLQSCDPAGVGARTLSECLLLQLNTTTLSNPVEPEVLACARKICEAGLEALGRADTAQLRAITGAPIELIRQAHALIRQLDPRPGKQFSAPTADFAVPDVLVHKIKGEWVLTINQAVMPSLRISEGYESMIRRLGKEAGAGMSEQLLAAKGFIRQVSQRFTTILDVSKAIMDKQRGFLEHGMAQMQPLTLRDVAEAVGMHESTISRATTQKFIATPHGVFELKRFFGSGVATDTGESASATAVQIRIRDYIQAEPEGKPLSDSRLTDLLAKDGITIARRTVAKYREVLGIPPAALRKARASLNGD